MHPEHVLASGACSSWHLVVPGQKRTGARHIVVLEHSVECLWTQLVVLPLRCVLVRSCAASTVSGMPCSAAGMYHPADPIHTRAFVWPICLCAIQVQRVSLEDSMDLRPNVREHPNAIVAMSMASAERFGRPASRGWSADAGRWGGRAVGGQLLGGGIGAAAYAGMDGSSAHASLSGMVLDSGGSADGAGGALRGAAPGRTGAATSVPTAVRPWAKSGALAPPRPWGQTEGFMAAGGAPAPGNVTRGPTERAQHGDDEAAATVPAWGGKPASRGTAASEAGLQQGIDAMASGAVPASLLCASAESLPLAVDFCRLLCNVLQRSCAVRTCSVVCTNGGVDDLVLVGRCGRDVDGTATTGVAVGC